MDGGKRLLPQDDGGEDEEEDGRSALIGATDGALTSARVGDTTVLARLLSDCTVVIDALRADESRVDRHAPRWASRCQTMCRSLHAAACAMPDARRLRVALKGRRRTTTRH